MVSSRGGPAKKKEIIMKKGTILVVGSNATLLEAKGGGTILIGQFLNETAVPIMALVEAGYDFVLATPTGEKPHMDKDSDALIYFGGDDEARQRARNFFVNDPAMNKVRTLRSVVDDGLDRYAGVFFPGGHAPVVDVMQDPSVREILRHFHAHKTHCGNLPRTGVDSCGTEHRAGIPGRVDRRRQGQGRRTGQGLAV